MRIELHAPPEQVLARNLRSAFDKLEYSGRSAMRDIGGSNRTWSTILKGSTTTTFAKLLAVAKYVGIPLWQLLCPAFEPEMAGEEDLHELIENFMNSDPRTKTAILHMAEMGARSAAAQKAS